MSWAPELGHNLLNTIPLAQKGIEVFLRKAGQPLKIVDDEGIFGSTNMIGNQYVIRLAETSIPVIFNRVTTSTIKTWYT